MARFATLIVRGLCAVLISGAIAPSVAAAGDAVVVYKTPRCGCCGD